MNHAEMEDEIYELYLLGVLDPAQSSDIADHLREGCDYCSAKVREAQRITTAMAGMANQIQPPASLRRRVLTTVARPKHQIAWIYAAAVLAAACIALLIFSIWSGNESRNLRNQLAGMRTERNELRSALEMMSRPETRVVRFGIAVNGPRGRVFVSNRGGVVFVGTGLPELPPGRIFELWVVPAKGVPKPAGVFGANRTGEAVRVTPPDINASGAAAVAVSVEPFAGSSAPTTKPFLIVPLS